MDKQQNCVQDTPVRKYEKWGEVVRLAARIADRSESAVYKVLKGRMVSARITRAIGKAEVHLANRKKRAA